MKPEFTFTPRIVDPGLEDRIAEMERKRKAQEAETRSQLTPCFSGLYLDQLSVDKFNAKAIDAARSLLAGERHGLGMYGKPGAGKSSIAAALANELIRTGTSVVMVTMVEYSARLRDTMDRGALETERQAFNYFAKAGLLIIDDLGVEPPTEFLVAQTHRLIDYRISQKPMLPMIVTSMYSMREMLTRELDRGAYKTWVAAMDRLEVLTSDWIEVGGFSRRPKRRYEH